MYFSRVSPCREKSLQGIQKLSVVKSLSRPKCTARVDKYTEMQTYALRSGFQIDPFFMKIGRT